MAYTTIDDPEEYFNSVIFTGDGTDDRAITVGFEPNLSWVRQRTDASGGYWVDSVRGNNAALQTTNSNAEGTFADMTFTSTGITVSSNENLNNEDAHNYVSWHWKESATAGFDIVSYTGNGSVRTIAHNLGSVPKMIIWKSRSNVSSWHVWHNSLPLSGGEYQAVQLNSTAAASPFGTYSVMNATAPTSSVFTLDGADYNTNTYTYIAYLFAEKQGYSKFGSYTGNGNADSTFIYTGFSPAWVMIKRTTGTTYNWMIFDNKRSTSNVIDDRLLANTSGAEVTGSSTHILDFVSNGFKIRSSNSAIGGGSDPYIYMAFAEAPFVSSSGVPATAR